jgi:hypothetical protein
VLVQRGLVARDDAEFSFTGGILADNVLNGALIAERVTATFLGNLFRANGRQRGIVPGHNGLELLDGFAGTATIAGNTFRDNTGFGVFASSGSNIQIMANLFENHPVAIGLQGTDGRTVAAVIRGNRLRVGNSPSPASDEGIFLLGSGARATIGGETGAAVNVFENYGRFNAIDPSDTGGPGNALVGCPVIVNAAQVLAQNVFINSPDPLRPCDGLPGPG